MNTALIALVSALSVAGVGTAAVGMSGMQMAGDHPMTGHGGMGGGMMGGGMNDNDRDGHHDYCHCCGGNQGNGTDSGPDELSFGP